MPCPVLVRPAQGLAPSFPPLKEWSTVSWPSGDRLNTVPQPMSSAQPVPAPASVVPNKTPLSLSRIRAPYGEQPSSPPAKLYSNVSVPLGAILNTTPQYAEPPPAVVPYRLPSLSEITPAHGPTPSLAPVKA